MKVDKDFTYQIIDALRIHAKIRGRAEYDRSLMLAAANVMENNIREYLYLVDSLPKED